MRKSKSLAVVQCGGEKIWREQPKAGPTAAKSAYVSGYFRKNRAYAERFAERWCILSAKYGFLEPTTRISNYDVSFHEPETKPLSMDRLRTQARAKRLYRYGRIIVLGGALYADKITEVFRDTRCKVYRPFRGLKGIGYIQKAVSNALKRGRPLRLSK